MAYKKEELEKQALAAIKEHELIFIEEIVSFLPCSVATFYNHKLEELETIKSAIEGNKISTKAQLRKDWKNSDNATLNIALYKLCASGSELEKLTSQTNKNLNKEVDEFKGKTDKEIEEEVKALNERGQQKTD